MNIHHPKFSGHRQPRRAARLGVTLLVIFIIALLVAAAGLTFFAVPGSSTLVILRGQQTRLFDSPSAMCQRANQAQAASSPACEQQMLSYISANAPLLLRLPYLDFVYTLSLQ